MKQRSSNICFASNMDLVPSTILYGNHFPPLKIYCYNLSSKWRPFNQVIKNEIYNPSSSHFQFFMEIEIHRELLLSPLLTKNPEEADLFFIPVYLFSLMYVHHNPPINLSNLFDELRSLGPWFDKKNGADHILISSIDPAWHGKENLKILYSTQIILNGICPVYRKTWTSYEYKRNVVLPFVSYFPDYNFDDVDWDKKRSNTVFLALSLKAKAYFRKRLMNILKNIPRSDLIEFESRDNQILEKFLPNLPKHFMDSDFCICPKGDNSVSKRIYDAALFGCIPVFVSDGLILPFYGNLLNYSKFSLRIPEKEMDKIPEILSKYTQEDILRMRKELRKAAKMFRYRLNEPPRVGESFWAISWMWYTRFLYAQQFDINYNQFWYDKS